MSELLRMVGEVDDRTSLIGLHGRRGRDGEETLEYIGAVRQQPSIHLERMTMRKQYDATVREP